MRPAGKGWKAGNPCDCHALRSGAGIWTWFGVTLVGILQGMRRFNLSIAKCYQRLKSTSGTSVERRQGWKEKLMRRSYPGPGERWWWQLGDSEDKRRGRLEKMLGVIPTGSMSTRNCRGNRETPVQNNSHGATVRTLVSFTELGEMEEKGWERERKKQRFTGTSEMGRLHHSEEAAWEHSEMDWPQ